MIKKIFIYFLIAGMVALFIWTFWFLYQKSQKKPVTYETEKAFHTNIIQKTVSAGSITPRKEVTIKSVVSGVVDQLYVEPGDYVEKGALVARIRIIPNMANLNNAESSVNRAKLQLQQAETEYNRYKKLYDEQLIPQVEYNQYLLT
ncbi:MAG: biotin/lipoyl-binding protein, partial [Cytophagales bacterium]|nr:biotin/lipoyl-binding protein [Cytophaga sp.]